MARRIKSRGSGKSGFFSSAANNNVDLGADFLGAGPLTFSVWIRIRGLGENSQGTLIDNSKFRVRLNANFGVDVSSDISTFATSATKVISNQSWAHVACTRNSTGVTNIYINGALSGSANQAGGTPAAGTTNVLLGTVAALSRDFNGKMKNARAFNRVLTAAEIADMYYDGQMPQDLAGAQLFHIDFNDNVLDQTGNGHDGTVTGMTYGVDIPVKRRMNVQPSTKCISFGDAGATTDVVDTGADWIGTGDVTLSVWIKPRSIGQTNGRIISNNKFDVRMTSSNRLDFSSNKSTYVISVITNGGRTLPFNQWAHLTITRKSDGKGTIYFNAQSVSAIDGDSGTPAAGVNVYIGNTNDSLREFDGAIADLRVYPGIFSQQQIEDIYFQGTASRTPIRSFSFDNTLVDDVTGNAATATGTNYSTNVRSTARVAASNRLAVRDFGTALKFDGVNDEVVISNDSMAASVVAEFSTSFWFKANQIPSSTSFTMLYNILGGAGFYPRIVIDNTPVGVVYCQYRIDNVTQETNTTSQKSIQLNKWYHCAVTINAITGGGKLYLNGALAGVDTTVGTLITATGTGEFHIGLGQSSVFFPGVIDQVRVWNTELSAQEIADMYYLGTVPKGSALKGEWLLDEGSGTTATDTSGAGNNGTIDGATYTTNVAFIPRVSA